jgi:CubicO group peptidase (beta-lactamase class C family)
MVLWGFSPNAKNSWQPTGERVVGIFTAVLLLLCLCGAQFFTIAFASEARTPGLDPTLHTRAMDRALRLRRLRSLLLSIDGTLVEERYYNGARPSRRANVKSASKSLLSILVGIAIDRGYISSVRAPIGQFFPEYFRGADDSPKKTITIEDLLTMRSGLETTSNRNYGRWVQSRNWVRHVLTRPMVDVPGGRMIYSTGNSHLLSAILTRTTGTSTLDFARRYLAGPLGIQLGPWLRDPQGIYFGGNEMHLTPRAMIEIGELYLNRGRFGDKQVVSEGWIRESLEPRTRSRWSGRQYAYGWWIWTLGGHPAYYAWGHSGQFIFVVPDLKLVAVATSSLHPRQKRQERREYRQALYDLLDQDLVPAADGKPLP